MKEVRYPEGDEPSGLRIRPLEEVIPLVQANAGQNRAALGIPTKTEIEDSDSRVPSFMCDPFLEADDFLARTAGVQAILVVAFATGAMPDRLVLAMQQRMAEGIPVFVLSNNPGDEVGILRVRYAAGSGAYEFGAVGLQRVNVNQHCEVKAAILEALAQGLKGADLIKEIEQRYAYKEGEKIPLAEWDDPDYVAPPRRSIMNILRDSGFTDGEGNYLPPQ